MISPVQFSQPKPRFGTLPRILIAEELAYDLKHASFDTIVRALHTEQQKSRPTVVEAAQKRWLETILISHLEIMSAADFFEARRQLHQSPLSIHPDSDLTKAIMKRVATEAAKSKPTTVDFEI